MTSVTGDPENSYIYHAAEETGGEIWNKEIDSFDAKILDILIETDFFLVSLCGIVLFLRLKINKLVAIIGFFSIYI